MIKRKTKIAEIVIASMTLFFAVAIRADAFEAPRIFIKEINMSAQSVKGGDSISGNFKVWNSTKDVISNLSYSISLRVGNAVFKEDVHPASFSMEPNKTIDQKFSFSVPSNIRTDEYKLRVQFFTQSGIALGWEEKDISVTGNGTYLYLSDVALLKSGTIVNPSRGESFSPDVVPKVMFTVANSSDKEILFDPAIFIYEMQISGEEVKQMNLPKEKLASGERKDIVAELVQMTKPTSYLGKINIYVNGEMASNVGEFRWVVEGIGARITNIATDKNSYAQGEEMEITIDLVGPADNSDIGEGRLIIEVFSQEGEVIAKEERVVKLNSNNVNQAISVVATRSIVNPKIEARIVKGEQELARYAINEKRVAEVSAKKQESTGEGGLIKILFAVMIIIISILLLARFAKKKGPLSVIILFVMLAATGIFGNAKAWTMESTWNKPVPNPLPEDPYYPGDPITFQGSYASYACSNEITDAKISSYICDVNEEHCAPTGEYYPAWLNSLAYDSANKKMYASNSAGNSVMRLDFNSKNVEARYGMGALQPGEFGYPWDTVFVADTGYIYATDSAVSRLVRFDPADKEGTWEELGSLGSGISQFNSPKGIFYDSVGKYIYVADSLNNRIVRFKPADAVWTANWESFGTYGNYGSGAGRFNKPEGVSFDPGSGYVYVGDTENFRIVRFKPLNNGSGGYSDWRVFGDGSWGHDNNSFIRPSGVYYSSDSQYVYVAEASGYAVSMFKPDAADWTMTMDRVTDNNTYSQDPGGFAVVQDIFYDSGYVYLIDSYRGIVKFQQGNVLPTWETYGSKGVGRGRFNFPIGFNYDVSTGYMYVADSNNKRVIKFDYDGGSGTWLPFGSVSDLEGSFNKPTGVFFDEANNHLYVADSNSSRVVRFTPNADGTFSNWESWGYYGTGNGQFIQPYGIYYDSAKQLLYVSDAGRDQIIEFKPQTGGNIAQWSAFGTYGDGVGKFKDPAGVHFDPESEYLYVADMWGTRIVRFKPSDAKAPVNNWIANWRSYGNGWGTGVGQFEMPMNVHYDTTAGQEYLYVADFNNGRVIRFRPDDANWTDNWMVYGTRGQGGGQFEYVAGVYYDTAENYLYVADSYRGGYSTTDNTRIARFDPNGNTVGNFAGNWDTMDMSFREYLINTKVPLSFEPGFTLGADGLARAKIVVEGFTVETGRIRTYLTTYGDIYLSLAGSANPTLNIFSQTPMDYCSKDLPGAVSLKWEFNDEQDGYGNQTAYQIELNKYNGLGVFVTNCSPPKQGSAASPNITTTLLGTEINVFCPGFISYGGFTYDWKLKVFDSDDNENIGGFKDGDDFPFDGAGNPPEPTPDHEYPVAEFSYDPDTNLKQFMDITFDPSLSRIAAGVFVKQLGWDFDGDGTIEPGDETINPVFPGVDLAETKVHSYPTVGSKTVDLKITDSDGFNCWAHDRNNEEDIDILTSKPKWDETFPD